MSPPPAWLMLTGEWFELPPAEAAAWWGALARSQSPRPQAMRQQLALVGHVRLDLEHLMMQVLTPKVVVGVIEDLVLERRLRRRQANRIEGYLLGQMTASGQWR